MHHVALSGLHNSTETTRWNFEFPIAFHCRQYSHYLLAVHLHIVNCRNFPPLITRMIFARLSFPILVLLAFYFFGAGDNVVLGAGAEAELHVLKISLIEFKAHIM